MNMTPIIQKLSDEDFQKILKACKTNTDKFNFELARLDSMVEFNIDLPGPDGVETELDPKMESRLRQLDTPTQRDDPADAEKASNPIRDTHGTAKAPRTTATSSGRLFRFWQAKSPTRLYTLLFVFCIAVLVVLGVCRA